MTLEEKVTDAKIELKKDKIQLVRPMTDTPFYDTRIQHPSPNLAYKLIEHCGNFL
jgi:hypothetical protein